MSYNYKGYSHPDICTVCSGSGEGPYEGSTCDRCCGSGAESTIEEEDYDEDLWVN